MNIAFKTEDGKPIGTYRGPRETQRDAAKTAEMILAEACLDERGLEAVSGCEYSGKRGRRRHTSPGVGLAFIGGTRYVVDICGTLHKEA